MNYWNEWQRVAEAYIIGKSDEPPDSPPTQTILNLLTAVREVDRVLSDPRSALAMPATAKRIKRVLNQKKATEL